LEFTISAGKQRSKLYNIDRRWYEKLYGDLINYVEFYKDPGDYFAVPKGTEKLNVKIIGGGGGGGKPEESSDYGGDSGEYIIDY